MYDGNYRELIEEIAKFEEREFSAKKSVSQVYTCTMYYIHISCSRMRVLRL